MRDTIRFLWDETPHALRGLPPTMTVLEWLRTEARACGTKEGCAEGDCGACTVVLGTPGGQGMRYRAVNACILFIPALDGCQLLTVENLAGPDGALHPVQQAMVEHHASQCGFCTPGFVMSIFARAHQGPVPNDRGAVLDALAGNLCRCTGYRPIIDAAAAVCAAPPQDRFAAASAATAARLHAMDDGSALRLDAPGAFYAAPRTEPELAALLLAHPTATILAGGTDVGLWVTKQHRDLPAVVSVERVAGLAEIAEADGALRIGAAATYDDAMEPLLANWPGFGRLLRRLGSTQVRARGTIGGNIANGSPIGDSMPALIALDARVVLRRGPDERSLPLEDFFLGYRRTALAPGEYVRRIDVPLPDADDLFFAEKLSKRLDQDISAVCVALRLRLRGGVVADARIGVGGMAAVPARAARAEAALIGRPWSHAAVATAMAELDAEFTPIADMRASADYRRMAAGNLLLRMFLEHQGERVRLPDPEGVAA